jgi:hypothetical protein
MSIRNRFVAAATVVAALAAAGPVAGAGAAQSPVAIAPGTTTSTSSIPCFPFPAWCGPDGQPLPSAPWWVRPALGLPPTSPWPPLNILPVTIVPPLPV